MNLDQAAHIDHIVEELMKDPGVERNSHLMNYSDRHLVFYLMEVVNKDGSLLNGLISALEKYLNK